MKFRRCLLLKKASLTNTLVNSKMPLKKDTAVSRFLHFGLQKNVIKYPTDICFIFLGGKIQDKDVI